MAHPEGVVSIHDRHGCVTCTPNTSQHNVRSPGPSPTATAGLVRTPQKDAGRPRPADTNQALNGSSNYCVPSLCLLLLLTVCFLLLLLQLLPSVLCSIAICLRTIIPFTVLYLLLIIHRKEIFI